LNRHPFPFELVAVFTLKKLLSGFSANNPSNRKGYLSERDLNGSEQQGSR